MGLTLSETLRDELTEEYIQKYTSITSFNRKQILKLYDIYRSFTKSKKPNAEDFIKTMKISEQR
jgi:preprotein translocase subunit Sss1